MKNIFATMSAMTMLVSSVWIGPVKANPHHDDPVVKKIIFSSHTLDDDKDHDTGVYLEIKTADGSGIIAHANNRDSSNDDGTQYKDNSDHEFTLDVDGDTMTRDDCKGFKVKVWQHTHGHDTWKFNGKVTIVFNHGPNLVASKDGIKLVNDNASDTFSAP